MRHLGKSHLDEAECGRVAASLRASLAHYGLTPNPTSVVARMITVSDRAHHDGVLATQDDEQVRLLGQGRHVAKVLEWFQSVKDEAGVVSRVKKSLDRIAEPGAKALDHLFEMEVAGRLARTGFLSVTTAEPDVVADLPASEFPGQRRVTFACKHPDTGSGVAECIEKGGEQIDRRGEPGIIMVSLDSVVHQVGRWLSVAAPDDASDWARGHARRLTMASEGSLSKVFKSDLVLGAVLVLVVPYQIEERPRSTGFHMGGNLSPNLRIQGTEAVLRSLVAMLYEPEGLTFP